MPWALPEVGCATPALTSRVVTPSTRPLKDPGALIDVDTAMMFGSDSVRVPLQLCTGPNHLGGIERASDARARSFDVNWRL
jgi:hypothetical protein